jgi:single-strand DNA-binding protein
MYQNRDTLIGFLGRDAEVKTTRHNASFAVLSLATQRTWKDRESGERKSQTTWHRCIAWGRLADFAAALTKGAHVQIEGEIRNRQYQPQDATSARSITEVRVLSITKLDRPNRPEETAA